MATQQVKFHSVTTEQYNETGRPLNDGSLYFISDNGEIRKGEQHITGSRVFTAFDSTGSTPVEELDIKIDNVSIGTPKHQYELTESDVAEGAEYAGQTAGTKVTIQYVPAEGKEQPKRGDMLVVEGAGGLSSYVYNHNGGDYDPQYWLACSSGKLDASKIVITEDLTMAGAYTNIGNYKKTTEGQLVPGTSANGGTAGMTFQDVLDKMFSQINEPTWKKNPPTASISATSGGTVEIGTTVSSTFTASLSDAYALYDGQSTNQYAGCKAEKYHFDGDETGSTTNKVTKSWVAGVDSAPSASVTIDYKEGTNTPKNNLGNASTKISPSKIPAGTTVSNSTTATVTVYRNWFYGVDTDGTGEIDSALIRSLTKGGNCETALTKATGKHFITGEGAKRVIIAIPQKKAGDACVDKACTLKEVYLASASDSTLYENNTDVNDATKYRKLPEAVTVYDATGTGNGIAYDVWFYQPASISPTEEHNIEIG